MFLHKFDILNRNQNGLFQNLLPVCDEIMRRDEIRWFDGNDLDACKKSITMATRMRVGHRDQKKKVLIFMASPFQ